LLSIRIILKANIVNLFIFLFSFFPGTIHRTFWTYRVWTYVWQHWMPSLSICFTMFQKHWIIAESYPVSQLYVNTLLATKITLNTNGI
jgi:hypothetical protein